MRADRRRYVVFAVDPGTPLNHLDRILENMKPKDARYFSLILYDEGEGKGIIRCPHTHLDNIRAHGKGSSSAIRILGVSGTIKRARMKFLRPRGQGLR